MDHDSDGEPPAPQGTPTPRAAATGRRPMGESPGILTLGFPLVISFVIRASFTLVDRFYAGSFEFADAAQAAIGLTMPFEFLLTAFWVGSSNGLTARISSAMGAGQGCRIEQLKRATYKIIAALLVLFMLLAAWIWFFSAGSSYVPNDPGNPELARQFRIYGVVVIAGSAITSFWSILPDSLVKAHQDMKGTMWAGLWSGFTNVVLNTLFVFAFGWGIFGVALSTVIGRIAGLVYALRRAGAHERRRIAAEADANDPTLFERPLWAILSLAIPASITFIVLALESFGVNTLLARLEDAEASLAAWSVFDSIVRFLYMPPVAIGVALLPLAARLWGAGELGRIRSELNTALRASLIYVAVFVAPVALLGGNYLAEVLTDSELAHDYVVLGMVWVPLGVLTTAPFFLVRSCFEGMQEPRPGLVISVLRSLLLSLPLVAGGMWLAPQYGRAPVLGAYAGFTLAGAIASVALVVWNRRWMAEQEAGLALTPDPSGAAGG